MAESDSNSEQPNAVTDPLWNPHPDPWEDTETAHLRAFLKLTYSERFHLLMDAIEFMHRLRPPRPESEVAAPLPAMDPPGRRENAC